MKSRIKEIWFKNIKTKQKSLFYTDFIIIDFQNQFFIEGW